MQIPNITMQISILTQFGMQDKNTTLYNNAEICFKHLQPFLNKSRRDQLDQILLRNY